MKGYFRILSVGVIVIMLISRLTACSGFNVTDKDIIPGQEIANDGPTIPENAPEGLEYIYDFNFSEKYDNKISEDFSLVLSNKIDLPNDTLFLFEKYQNESSADAVKEYLYDGDGLMPCMHKRYWNTFQDEGLMIGTHYYEPDNVEYISYIWSNIEGARTNKNIAVGSSEKELLFAHTDDLYYIDRDEAVSGAEGLSTISIIGYQEGNSEELDENYDFDYAYMWQPFTPETNELRDITFYIKDGKVVAIEIVQPFELRHVYGYDRDAGLQYTEEQRKN
ncbi:MAG TPA: hypothetical protein VFC70_03585 [Oscillospiraceae bacterium]|nr:hypothetical protein [Oscillospiraceae bacterium]